MSTTTTTPPKQDGEDQVLERLQRLVQRAEQGDESVLGELRAARRKESAAAASSPMGPAPTYSRTTRPATFLERV